MVLQAVNFTGYRLIRRTPGVLKQNYHAVTSFLQGTLRLGILQVMVRQLVHITSYIVTHTSPYLKWKVLYKISFNENCITNGGVSCCNSWTIFFTFISKSFAASIFATIVVAKVMLVTKMYLHQNYPFKPQ